MLSELFNLIQFNIIDLVFLIVYIFEYFFVNFVKKFLKWTGRLHLQNKNRQH